MESAPQIATNPIEGELTDEVLDFGDLWMPTGSAYFQDGRSARDLGTPAKLNLAYSPGDPSIPVAKHWQAVDRSALLTESLRWKDLQPMTSTLPEIGDTEPQPPPPAAGSVQIAQKPYSPATVVLDYTVVSGSGDYQFQNPETYFISGPTYFGGLVTFGGRSFLKYR